MVQTQKAFQDEFHRLLGRLVHAHARFDFNIGLQLNWLGSYYQIDVAEQLDPRKAQLGTRLKKLKQLILDMYQPAGGRALDRFQHVVSKSRGRQGASQRLCTRPLGRAWKVQFQAPW